ncbi:pyridoxine 5'-phosphate synthase [Echinimonas agarilytica]|uniref:Pyridoxine 5'-phosphate synthase n=1 Tax=Echinimonas agarilytica TaxID=1215918 RepID=A0AA41W4Q8_9GAMM|nr:pyridoxine 5'-phosphate synthase [Echinimonas agarilytica]
MKEILLGVNIDHVATLRQARQVAYPDTVHAASLAEQAGADGITIHLREDRRHIQDRDVEILAQTLNTRMNLEMAATDEMVAIATRIKPEFVCLVPEKRAELTTEGGLDVLGHQSRMQDVVGMLAEAGIKTSLFIDAEEAQIEAAKAVGAPYIELHTGAYADVVGDAAIAQELNKITHGAKFADDLGLCVNAGHGLHYHNVVPIAAIPQIEELNIGHSIIARAIYSGLPEAVETMKRLIVEARVRSAIK